MKISVPQNLFTLFLLQSSSECAQQGTKKDDPQTCPCFSSSTLELFSIENTNVASSCKGLPNGLYIWKVQDPNTWHPMGYGARLDQPTTCLFEGDMVRLIEPEEARACLELIQNRCQELGLLTGSREDMNQFQSF